MLLKSDFIPPGLVLQKIQLPFNTSPIAAIGTYSDVHRNCSFFVATDLNYAVTLKTLKSHRKTLKTHRKTLKSHQVRVDGSEIQQTHQLRDRGWKYLPWLQDLSRQSYRTGGGGVGS